MPSAAVRSWPGPSNGVRRLPRDRGVVVVAPAGFEDRASSRSRPFGVDAVVTGGADPAGVGPAALAAVPADVASSSCATTRPARSRPRSCSTRVLDALDGWDGVVPVLPVVDTVKRVAGRNGSRGPSPGRRSLSRRRRRRSGPGPPRRARARPARRVRGSRTTRRCSSGPATGSGRSRASGEPEDHDRGRRPARRGDRGPGDRTARGPRVRRPPVRARGGPCCWAGSGSRVAGARGAFGRRRRVSCARRRDARRRGARGRRRTLPRHRPGVRGDRRARPARTDRRSRSRAPGSPPDPPTSPSIAERAVDRSRARCDATRLAEALGIPIERVSVKATRPEGLGLSGEGVGCLALAVLARS